MSSVAGAFSQVAPFKRWIVGADGGELYSKANGTSVVANPVAGTVLQDMGKTVFLANGGVLRKVAPAKTSLKVGAAYGAGYIWISDTVPADQNITLLN
jgi:hypothetical protein